MDGLGVLLDRCSDAVEAGFMKMGGSAPAKLGRNDFLGV